MEPADYIKDPKGGVAPGRIVTFVVGQGDVDRLKECGGNASNTQVGDQLPAMLVKVWNPDTGMTNLKVFTDAPKDYWATSVGYAEHPMATELANEHLPVEYPGRTWHWPARVA